MEERGNREQGTGNWEQGTGNWARRGFTLVEMLVVIGILAILIGIGISSFSSATKKAQKTRGQELVNNVATALEAIYQREGSWPRRILANGTSDGRLDENVAYELAKRKVMTLTYDENAKKTTGLDRCGIVTPWAQDSIKTSGQSVNTGSKVKSGGTVKDHILHYAVDDDGDGFVDASVGGNKVKIRAAAAVWSCNMSGGEISPYAVKGQGSKSQQGNKKGGLDDLYSWTKSQVKQ